MSMTLTKIVSFSVMFLPQKDYILSGSAAFYVMLCDPFNELIWTGYPSDFILVSCGLLIVSYIRFPTLT